MNFLHALLFFCSTALNSWNDIFTLPNNHIMKFNILLKQQNIDRLENELIMRSDPSSSMYNKWLTQPEIDNIIKPINYQPLNKWLQLNNVVFKNNTDNLECSAPVSTIFSLFDVSINRGTDVIFSLPSYLEPHIDMVLGFNDNYDRSVFSPSVRPFTDGDSIITPESINVLYNITGKTFSTKSSQSVVEFLNDNCYNNDDLQQFLNDSNLPNNSVSNKNFWGKCSVNTSNPDIEATLDIQYQTAINVHSDLYYISVSDWLYQFSNFIYRSKNPPNVISMSYGWAEWDQCDPQVFPTCLINVNSEEYAKRTNIEFIKLGLRGITLVASSGDAGAPGRTNEQCSDDNVLNPSFPASSPWVLSVGGTIFLNVTAIKNPISPLCKNNSCIGSGTELNCNFDRCGWTSGGGFSSYFNRPSWQVNASLNYLNNTGIFPPEKYFNKEGRIYPDISLVAHNYFINTPDGYQNVDGTSASAPSISAMIAILNNLRLSKGQPSLGPVGPLLYNMAVNCKNCFKDISIGSNNSTEFGECEWGYQAVDGFDAVYGLGVPNFNEIYKYVDNLTFTH